jgi:hypothetical protein
MKARPHFEDRKAKLAWRPKAFRVGTSERRRLPQTVYHF